MACSLHINCTHRIGVTIVISKDWVIIVCWGWLHFSSAKISYKLKKVYSNRPQTSHTSSRVINLHTSSNLQYKCLYCSRVEKIKWNATPHSTQPKNAALILLPLLHQRMIRVSVDIVRLLILLLSQRIRGQREAARSYRKIIISVVSQGRGATA